MIYPLAAKNFHYLVVYPNSIDIKTQINMLRHPFVMLLSFLSILSYGQELAFKTNGRLILGVHKERTASIGVGDIDEVV